MLYSAVIKAIQILHPFAKYIVDPVQNQQQIRNLNFIDFYCTYTCVRSAQFFSFLLAIINPTDTSISHYSNENQNEKN